MTTGTPLHHQNENAVVKSAPRRSSVGIPSNPETSFCVKVTSLDEVNTNPYLIRCQSTYREGFPLRILDISWMAPVSIVIVKKEMPCRASCGCSSVEHIRKGDRGMPRESISFPHAAHRSMPQQRHTNDPQNVCALHLSTERSALHVLSV